MDNMHNGRSTSGRIPIDWNYLESFLKAHSDSLSHLSNEIGHTSGYLNTCKYHNGVSADIIQKIVEITGIDENKLIIPDADQDKRLKAMIDDSPIVAYTITDTSKIVPKAKTALSNIDMKKIKIGTAVTHKLFGDGTIIKMDSNHIVVLFDNSHDEKKFKNPDAIINKFLTVKKKQ